MRMGTTRRVSGFAWLRGIIATVVTLAMVFGAVRYGTTVAQDYDYPMAPEDETPTAPEDGTPTAPPGEIGKAVIAEMPEGAVTYVVRGEESRAGYTVEQELVGQGAVDAVGETNAILGEIVLDAEGSPVAGSRIDVDLRTLAGTETQRDNYLRTSSLESDTFPLATFILTRVDDWTEPLAQGETSEFQLIGNLTVHGVTKEVAWESTATLDEDVISGTATVSVEMGDFDIERPSVGIVLSLDETVKLGLNITAAQAED